jgi:hypothetical protein
LSPLLVGFSGAKVQTAEAVALSTELHAKSRSRQNYHGEAQSGEVLRDISMPLTRGKVLGYDLERLAFRFSMLNDNESVECQISDAAMDELAGVRGTLSTARQAQFLAHRDAIEQIASDLFDTGPTVKGAAVRIFTKHIPK